jgi:hypothetical protein
MVTAINITRGQQGVDGTRWYTSLALPYTLQDRSGYSTLVIVFTF